MRIAFILIMLPLPAIAQIAVTKTTGNYPMLALSGSTRQLSVQVTSGGSICVVGTNTCEINWSAVATGSLTASFTDLSQTHVNVSSLSNALPAVTLNVGGTAGTCTITGSIGSYNPTCTSIITVTAQSVDDNTKSVTFTINVNPNQPATMANGDPSVRVLPFYKQAYEGQHIPLKSFVAGCVDETGVWSITQPGGGNGTLADTTYRSADFVATVPGRYKATYTSNCNGGTNYATIAVVPLALPSYPATPNSTVPEPCYFEAGLAGTLYDVGPTGHTYTTISSTPAFTSLAVAGSMIQIFNTDTTGLSPTQYPEYYVVQNNATQAQPFIICGVPDSLGNLPIITGANATGQAGISFNNGTVGYGPFSYWTGSSHYGYWQSGSNGPHFSAIWGLKFQDANPSFTYAQPATATVAVTAYSSATNTYILTVGSNTFNTGDVVQFTLATGPTALNTGTYTVLGTGHSSTQIEVTSAGATGSGSASGTVADLECLGGTLSSGGQCAWANFSASVNVRSGRDIAISSIESANPLCVFTDDNGNNAFSTYTQDVDIEGINCHNFGWTNSGVHGMYIQTIFSVVAGNLIGPAGAGFWPSGEGPSGLKSRGMEMIVENNVFGANLDRVLDFVEDQDNPSYLSMDQYLAAPGASNCSLSFWCLGDTAGQGVLAAYFEAFQKDFVYGNIIPNSPGGGQVHYGGDQGISDWQNHDGTLYFYNNTVWQTNDMFDTGYCSLGYRPCIIDARNNIFWPNSGTTISSFTRYIDPIFSATTNLFLTGSISTSNPLNGGSGGWSPNDNCSNQTTPCPWPLTNPLQTHMPGFPGQYLFTVTQPFTSGTYAVPSGSAAIAAATTLTGLPAQLPVRFQYNVSTSALVPRSLTDLTIGAQAYSSGTVEFHLLDGNVEGTLIQ